MANKNIVISGWPGTGVTTLSLILAKNLNYKLLRGTETFRELGRRMSMSDTGKDRVDADDYLEPIFGPVYDKYIDYKLLNSEKIIVETDIGAFRLGKRKEFYSFFLHADLKERIHRLGTDDRQKDISLVEAREKNLAKHYYDLHGIKWFDLKQIHEKYNFVMDNTDLSISDELKIAYKELSSVGFIKNHDELIKNADNEERNYWEKTKKYYTNELLDNNQIMLGEEVLDEIKNLFPEEIDNFPNKLKLLFS